MLLKPPYKFFQKFFYLKFNLIALSPIFDQGNVHWRLNWYFKSFWHFLVYQKNLNARKEYTAHQYLQIVSFDISQKKGNIQIFDQIKFIKICTLNNDHNIDPTWISTPSLFNYAHVFIYSNSIASSIFAPIPVGCQHFP
jgi:hypothetical protein